MLINLFSLLFSSILWVQVPQWSVDWSKCSIDVKEYSEIKIGKPKFYKINGIETNYNEIRIIKILSEVTKYIDDKTNILCEIGGGYGALAAKIKKKYLNKTIILIDIPEALILQSYYLTSIFPNCKFCFYEDFIKLSPKDILSNKYDFYLLPPWVKNKFVGTISIDFFINCHSFQEMDKKVISEYFNFIQNTLRTDGILYNLNRNLKIINNTPIRISEYPYDSKWEIISKKLDPLNSNMHEIISKRVKNSNKDFIKQVSGITKTNPAKRKISFLKIILRKILDIFMFFIPKKILLKLIKIYL